MLQLRHTLGPGFDDQFHVAVVRDKLTRNLTALFPAVRDEVEAAFAEYIPPTDGASHTSRACAHTDALLRA